ncbi:MAG: NAD(P)H-dependent oxidoreductase subunit E [Phycisphaerae bacterium]|nr:NAD(P)H-dependent oxidoreductase subunit E [Phycisphaerae bacterium]
MSETSEQTVKRICASCNHDRTRMMDIVREVQHQCGCVSGEAMEIIAKAVNVHRVEVASVVSFYAFLSERPKGKVVIRLCNDIIDKMQGADRVAQAFCDELGIKVGETTPDGKITLEETPCIGLCDQAPAALINDVPVTHISTDRAREIVKELRAHGDPTKLVRELGDGNNAHELVQSMVKNNLRNDGEIIFSPVNRAAAVRKALAMSPAEVIRAVKTARLRGRGGAGFPTGMKWEFTRGAPGEKRYVVCNADEGEPGTFKDRVILTERADRVFAGMTIAGYAIGAEEGILYLRAEYAYLRAFLEDVLAKRRIDNLLGTKICGKDGFSFDIRIQMGAGAYICGEETALLSSCEGLRGDPKNRPPFPAQKGYLGHPTVVNNVETLCCVTKILEEGPATFGEFGSEGSTGTKLLSISGDCKRPGIYELPLGVKLREVLKMAGAEDAAAVQVGGASGQMVSPADYDRIICFDDLATGGSMMVFGPQRNILEVAAHFMDFFIEESCGYCTPCRVGNVLLKERLDQILAGRGEPADLDYLQDLGQTVKIMSRCGLGQTSANPILTTLKNFRPAYEALVKENTTGFTPSFDLNEAVQGAEEIAGHQSVHAE